MKLTQRILLYALLMHVAILLLVVVLGELSLIDFSCSDMKGNDEFILLTIMELFTLCSIPLALRLFKFAAVRQQLREQREKALLKWGILRMDLLCLPMIINAVCYYVFMTPAFAYMAVIQFLCLVFIFPTYNRCQAEIEA